MANTPLNDSDATKNNAQSASSAAQGAKTNQGPPPSQDAGEVARKLPEIIAALQAEVNDLRAKQAEIDDIKDKLLRAHAEMENIRKRSEREKEDAAKYAITKLARDIVGVGDNFQRAIDAVPAGAAEQDPTLKSFLEGVTMTERELLNVLDRHGIKRLQPMNEPFNPHLHQAVTQLPRDDVPAGTIVAVYQAGYTIADRVLRPAMVGVAQGAAKPNDASSEGSGPVPPANENAPPA